MKACCVYLPLIMATLMTGLALGQTPYKLPPKDVVAILNAPPPPLPIVSPTRDSLLLADVRYYPSIAELAEPVLRLGGVRINPRVGCAQRRFVDTGLTVQPLDNAPVRRVELPVGSRSPIRLGRITASRSPFLGTLITRCNSGRLMRAQARRGRFRAYSSTTCSAERSSGCGIIGISSRYLCQRAAALRRRRRKLRWARTSRRARAA